MRHNPHSIPFLYTKMARLSILLLLLAILVPLSPSIQGEGGGPSLSAAPRKGKSQSRRNAAEEDSTPIGEQPGEGKEESFRKREREMDAKVDEIGQSWVNSFHKGSSESRKPSTEKGKGATEHEVRMNDPAPSASSPSSPERAATTEKEKPADGSGSDATSGTTSAQEEKAAGSRAAVRSYFDTEANQEEAPSFLSIVFKFFGMMMLLIGVLYAMVRYMKRKTGLLPAGNDLVQVVASVPVAPGKTLQIVDLAGRLVVLGVTESGVNLIMNVEDGGMADRIRLWQSRRETKTGTGEGGLLEEWTRRIRMNDLRFWNSEGRRSKDSTIMDFKNLLISQLGGKPDQSHPDSASVPTTPTSSASGSGSPLASEIDSTGGAATGIRNEASSDPMPGPLEGAGGVRSRSRGGERDPAGEERPREKSARLDGPDATADDIFERYFQVATTPEEQLKQRLQSQRRRLSHLKGKKI